jgi:hypothetical protein
VFRFGKRATTPEARRAVLHQASRLGTYKGVARDKDGTHQFLCLPDPVFREPRPTIFAGNVSRCRHAVRLFCRQLTQCSSMPSTRFVRNLALTPLSHTVRSSHVYRVYSRPVVESYLVGGADVCF